MDPVLIEKAQVINVEALYEIALESKDADIVRRAISALLETPGGVAYLQMHGLTV